MINYLKSVVFNCPHPKYKLTNGNVRYWHVFKRKCFPQGCIDHNIKKMVPNLTINMREYKEFLKECKLFYKWANTRSNRLRNSFVGVVQRVMPRFEISFLEGTLFYTFVGFTLVYKECLIDNTFFEDYVYVLIDKDTQDELNFHDEDTVSGSGHFHIDERGIVTISSCSKLKTIIPGQPINYWDAQSISQVSLQYISYLYQDKCMKCPYSLLTIERYHHRKRSPKNQLCCTIEDCTMGDNWE